MSSNSQSEFLALHASEGQMTPELAAKYLELGEGDTATAETDNQPEVVADEGQATKNADGQAEAKPVLMAKDGIHTIDYQKLVDAREGEKKWKEQAEASEAAILELKAQAQQRANAGQAPTDVDNVLAAATAAGFTAEQAEELMGDFSAEAMVKAITTIGQAQVQSEVSKLTAQFDSKINALTTLVKPLADKQAESGADSHFKTIHDRHPDAESINGSVEFENWIAKQPSFAIAGIRNVLANGEAAQVVELLDLYKGVTAPKTDYKTAAKDAVAKVQATVPLSISDIPGGRIGASSKYEALANMSPAAKAEAMADMTPEQVEAYLNRSM